MERKKENNQLKLMQIVPETGITGDYVANEFEIIAVQLTKNEEEWKRHLSSIETEELIEEHGGKFVRRYEERYPPTKFDLQINNIAIKERVRKLNEIVDELNTLYNNKEASQEKYMRLFLEAYKIAMGEGRYLTFKNQLEKEYGWKKL